MAANPPSPFGPLGAPLARDRQRNGKFPFVRCLTAWEDPWGDPPVPSDGWHWCALSPGHDSDHECVCGAVRAGAASPSRTGGPKAYRKLRGQVVA